MHVHRLWSFLLLAVLVPTLGSAQILYRPTPPPQTNAAAAEWQVRGEPLVYNGAFYYPAGAVVFFDGNRMVQVGEHVGIPLYADTTLEPFSIVYVPVAGGLMKPYERPRTGDLAGTVGSRTPALPVPTGVDLRSPIGSAQAAAPPGLVGQPPAAIPGGGSRPIDSADLVGTAGNLAALAAAPPAPLGTAPAPIRMQPMSAPSTNDGLWVEYEGRRWFSAGPALPFSPDRFTPVGDHRGFPVYRGRSGPPDTIYVTVVAGGPLAPYAAR